MRLRTWVMLIALVMLAGGTGPAWAKDKKTDKKKMKIIGAPRKTGEAETAPEKAPEKSEENAEPEEKGKESKVAGAPYPFTGPDTGAGFGFSIQYRDIFNKEGRDTSFSASYTSNQYLDLSVDWQEPYFLSQQGRLNLSVAYATRPSLRFTALGNDSEDRQASNYSWKAYTFTPTYIYRFPEAEKATYGLRVGLNVKWLDAGNGKYDDKDAGRYARPIKRVYPRLYRSWQFDPSWEIGPTFTVYRDSRKDRFPLGGGREEIVWPMKGGYYEFGYTRIEEALGSDFSFQRFSLDLRHYFPIISDDTIIAVRFRAVVNQGEVPIYEMASFGSGTDLRGYNGARFIDKNSTQFQIELRQAILPDYELPLLNGLFVAKYPSIALFWDEGRVYDDYTHIFENMWQNYHYSWGIGFRFVISPSIVIRFDYARSKEGGTFNMTSSLPF